MGEFIQNNESGGNGSKGNEKLALEYERVKKLIESGSDYPANRSHLELIAGKLGNTLVNPTNEVVNAPVRPIDESPTTPYSNRREEFIRQKHLIREKYAELRQITKKRWLHHQIPRATYHHLIKQYHKMERDELHRLSRYT